jgi:hypothetical protein
VTIPVGADAGGDGAKGGLSVAGIAGIAGGILAVAIALLVIILSKKTKYTECSSAPQETEESTTFNEVDRGYISEYGLSDGRPMDDVTDPGDEVRACESELDLPIEDQEGASEHNPEDLEGTDDSGNALSE